MHMVGRGAYDLGVHARIASKRVEEALAWAREFEQIATRHHDEYGRCEARICLGDLHLRIGDIAGALAHFEPALRAVERIGARRHQAWCRLFTAFALVARGDLGGAAEQARGGLAVLEPAGVEVYRALLEGMLGTVALCQGDPRRAARLLHRVVRLQGATGVVWYHFSVTLGRLSLALGQRAAALQHFQAALSIDAAVDRTLRTPLGPNVLNGIAELADSHEQLQALLAQPHGACAQGMALPQALWLERAEVGHYPHPCLSPQWGTSLELEWAWTDPFGDCAWALHDGLVLRAANGRDLWHVNTSAPRLLRPALPGDFAAQTICATVSDTQPAIGGLLLWQNREHYVVLERGHWGAADIAFRGCLDNQDLYLGRGRLPAERTWLRLERRGSRVRALCSADGHAWFTAGEVAFPWREGEQVGVHAIGMIDRTIFPGAFPAGTAILFASFGVWSHAQRGLRPTRAAG
jgi:tetratricopeptide (TPR) repeat protein